VKLVHLVGFITKKCVMMHGHTNVKKKRSHPVSQLLIHQTEARYNRPCPLKLYPVVDL